MQFVREFIDIFADLFRGNRHSYTVSYPENENEEENKTIEENNNKKIETKYSYKTKEFTQEQLLKHIHGEYSVGINPLNEFGNIRFSVIDVDVYPTNPLKYINILIRINLPLIGIRSKSGGLHLFVFFKQDTEATQAKPVMKSIVQLLGLPKETEILPNRTKLVGKQKGKTINLPYFRHKTTREYAYDAKGKKLEISDFLSYAKKSQITLKELTLRIAAIPLSVAPPCLQTLYVNGGVKKGQRNIFLFNCAVYLKAR